MNKKDKIDIIYEDKFILVVNKPYNLLTMATDNEKEKTLFHKVYTYLKQKNKNNKVFIIHRLDRDTSGIVVFAKDEKVKKILQDNWNELAKKRGYIAVVEGITEESKTVKSWLKETKSFITYSSSKPNDGKLAITKYKKIANNKKYSLLEIEILTGRKNQIRVHMKDIGHPIVGDKKYGSIINPLNRLCLHANKLELIHPITKEEHQFELKTPQNFINLIDKNQKK